MKNQTSQWLAISSLSTIISFFIQTLTTIILARIFTPEQFGAIAAVAIVTSYADIFWQMGLGPSIVQKKHVGEGDISTAHLTSILLGLFTAIFLSIFSRPISSLVGLKNPSVLVCMSVAFIVNSFGVIPNSLLQRNLKFKQIAIKDVLGNVVYLFSAIILGITGFGVWALVIASNLRYLVLAILPYYFIRKEYTFKIKLFSINKIKEMMNFGIGYSISRILNVTTSQIDYIIVSKNIGEIALGIYSRAFQLMTVPANLIGQIVDLVYFPVMSKIQNEDAKLNKIFINFTNLMSLLYFPVSSLLYLFADEFVLIFLGENWMLVSGPLKILGLSLFFRVGYKITDPLFRAKGAVYERAFLHLIQAILTALFAYVGVKVGGIDGVAIGVSLSLVINYILISIRVSKLISVNVWNTNIKILVAMTLNYILIPVLQFIKQSLYDGFSALSGFFATVLISLVLFICINIICVKKVYDKESMDLLIDKLKKKVVK